MLGVRCSEFAPFAGRGFSDLSSIGRSLFLAAALGASAAAASTNYFHEVEVKTDVEAEGRKDFTVRFTPEMTHQCDRIVFECFYHQEFPWENARGKKYTKTIEPVRFTYVRSNVHMVNELDSYISFKVPTSRDLLQRTYGPTVFSADYPVTVPRIRATAEAGGKKLWSYILPTDSKVSRPQDAAEEDAPTTNALPRLRGAGK